MTEILKWTMIGIASLLCSGAVYLFATRGDAIMLDLQGAVLACF